jgi:MFS family permease
MIRKMDKLPSVQSMVALSALVFLISDVQGGVGPFLSVYLDASLKWNVNEIGIALATLNIVTVVSQIPSGLIIDSVSAKRFLVAVSCIIITLACIIITRASTLLLVVVAQSIIGIASSIISPAITAITLGLVGRRYFAKRLSINGTFNHAGNVMTAMVTGLLAVWLGGKWILYVVILFCLVSLIPLFLIKKGEINSQVARELPDVAMQAEAYQPVSMIKLILNKQIIYFCITVFLFEFSNAAQLPLIGQELAKVNMQYASLFMASSIVLAQVVMMLVSYSLGFILPKMRRKPLIIIAFSFLILRALLYIPIKNGYVLLCLQVLDGMASGIYSIVIIVIISELGSGTGRFNFLQGLISFWIGIGSALSNLVGGYVAQQKGFNASFLFLALIAVAGVLFFNKFMPETKNNE